MRLLYVFFIGFSLVVFSGFQSPSLPELVLEFNGQHLEGPSPELSINLGQRKQGTTVAAQLVVKNLSPQPLLISNVRSSCGLSVPAWPRQPIETGRQAVIQIRYDSQRLGQIDRYITIHANTETGRTLVHIAGEIVP